VTLHDLGYHNNVCLLASYQNVNVTRQSLVRALEYAIHQHPALNAQVSSSEAAKPYFVRLSSIDLDEVIEYVDVPGTPDERSAWIDGFLSAQHSLGFHDKRKPLWRVVVLQHGDKELRGHDTSMQAVDIAFVWHHVIGDGKSGLAVHTSILQGLATPFCSSPDSSLSHYSEASKTDGKVPPTTTIKPQASELYPSLEQIFAMPASRSTKFKKWLSRYFGSCLPLQPKSQEDLDAKKWSGAPYHDESPIKTFIRHIIIPTASTNTLVKLCHEKKTSITAFLQALIGRTISRNYNHMFRLRCATAISMRRFMKPDLHISEQEMGLWVSAFHFELEARDLSATDQDKERFWQLSRKNRKRIANEIKKGDRDLGIGGLRSIPDFRENLKGKMGRKREDSFAVTNLGVWDGSLSSDGSSGEGARIGRMVFSQSCHVNGSALQFCIMSVRGGEMVIGVSWQEGTVPVKDTECIASALKAELMRLAEE